MRTWILILLLVACASAPPRPAGPPQRIISLVPSLTEVVFSLGAGARVVAVTANDTYPPEVRKLPRVGDIHPDYERILALKPDLVLGDSGLQKEQLQRLRRLGIPVLELDGQSLEGLQRALTELGGRLERAEEAERLRTSLRDDLQRRRAAIPKQRPRVFVEIWNRPLMTSGGGTYVDELIRLAGGENVYADLEGYPTINPEDLIRRKPEVIVLTVGAPDEALTRPGWSTLRARIHRIDPDLLVRPTLRAPQAIDQLRDWFQTP